MSDGSLLWSDRTLKEVMPAFDLIRVKWSDCSRAKREKGFPPDVSSIIQGLAHGLLGSALDLIVLSLHIIKFCSDFCQAMMRPNRKKQPFFKIMKRVQIRLGLRRRSFLVSVCPVLACATSIRIRDAPVGVRSLSISRRPSRQEMSSPLNGVSPLSC